MTGHNKAARPETSRFRTFDRRLFYGTMIKAVFTIVRLPKRERQERLASLIKENPFVTDEELTKTLNVSIQTIRLDRMERGIPELRERIKAMAEQSYDQVRSIGLDEVIGEVIDLQLDKSGISMFEIREEHVFMRNRIARGHHIFSQANSLAVAVINDEVALTASADIRFNRSVRLGERVIAKAYVRSLSKGKAKVEVKSFVMDELVFEGQFLIFHSYKDKHSGEMLPIAFAMELDEGGTRDADRD